MKISGFMIVRNGSQYGYPYLEAMRSLLPLVDELVVLVGLGEDDTLKSVEKLAAENSKVKVYQSQWDEKLRKEGLILSQQTNLSMTYARGVWGIYLQADEIIHEDDIPKIRASIEQAHQREEVDGLLFDYVHFYGDYSVVNKNPSAYRREVRVVRLDRNIRSWKDAQGFRKENADGSFTKLKVIHSEAKIYHYGWVRPPEVMKRKTIAMDRLYHEEGKGTGDNHIYKRIYGLEKFQGTHPKVMSEIVVHKNWDSGIWQMPLVFTWKDIRKVIARNIEKVSGWIPFEYRNYIWLKK
ncbi:MAG: glycosyltransferase family 2 protein [Oligoflexia bacterium]|nr:glycosyltransferase family 2 protein [Oligoflexia bacterium]